MVLVLNMFGHSALFDMTSVASPHHAAIMEKLISPLICANLRNLCPTSREPSCEVQPLPEKSDTD
jgi:hypothetical protein